MPGGWAAVWRLGGPTCANQRASPWRRTAPPTNRSRPTAASGSNGGPLPRATAAATAPGGGDTLDGAAQLALEAEAWADGAGATAPYPPRALGPREARITGFVNAVRSGKLQRALDCAEAFHAELEEGSVAELGREAAAQRASKVLFRLLYKNHQPFLEACLARGRLPVALRYMRLLPPDRRAWSLLLRTAVSAARTERLAKPLAAMQQITAARKAAGLPPDEWTASALISAARFESNSEAAVTVFEGSWGEGRRSEVLCSAMLAAHADAGDGRSAAELVQRMRSESISFDAVVYGSLLRAMGGSGDPKLLEDVLVDMAADGIAMDARLASEAINAGLQCGIQEAGWFRGVYGTLCEAGVVPSTYTLCSLFNALSGCAYLEIGEIDAALDIMTAFRQSGRTPNAEAYTALLSLCVKAEQPFRMLEVWEMVKEDGGRAGLILARNPFVCCALLSAAAAAVKQGRAQSAEAVLSVHSVAWWLYERVLRMPGWPTSAELGAPEELLDVGPPDTPGPAGSMAALPLQGDRRALLPAFNALLHFCAKAELTDGAVELLALMRSDGGPAPDAISYNAVIGGLAAQGKHQHGAYVMKEMQEDGVAPDAVTMAALLHACAKASNLKAAEEVMSSMVLLNIEPTVEIYSSLMDAHVQSESPSNVREVFVLLDTMREKGIMPTDITYIYILRACLLLKDADRAFAIYEHAYDEGVVLNDVCHNLLIKVCTVTGRLNEGVELVKRVARIHGELQSQTLNALIRALCGASVDRALRMLSLMRTLGMTPSTSTVLDLIDACAWDGNSQAAYSLYRGLSSAAHEIPRIPGSSLIRALCSAGDNDAALQVYNNMLQAGGAAVELNPSPVRPKGRRASTRKPRSQPLKFHYLPSPAARSSIAFMLSRGGDLDGALAVVAQMAAQEGVPGLLEAAVSNKQMFQELITSCCRAGRINDALHVFDEWKAAFARVEPQQSTDCCLNNAVLAFLEASCRAHGAPEWRVFDVIAIMRQQREVGVQAKLDRPSKRSHHFTDAWAEGDA